MKKITAFLLILTFVFTMSACSKNDEINDTTDYEADSNSESIMTENEEYIENDETDDDVETEIEDTDTIDPDFKEAMDAYEDFIDEYVDIMKQYSKNPTDTSILAKYTEYMTEYVDMMEKFEKWENEDLNAAELEYYVEVQGRVSKKLAQVAGY